MFETLLATLLITCGLFEVKRASFWNVHSYQELYNWSREVMPALSSRNILAHIEEKGLTWEFIRQNIQALVMLIAAIFAFKKVAPFLGIIVFLNLVTPPSWRCNKVYRSGLHATCAALLFAAGLSVAGLIGLLLLYVSILHL